MEWITWKRALRLFLLLQPFLPTLCARGGSSGEGVLVKVNGSRAASFGAKCLDGTPPAFYLWSGAEARKFVIFLEGGGWCFDNSQCLERRGTAIGSSSKDPAFMADVGGIMSMNATQNPYFANFTKVFIRYCDGSSFTSARVAPVMLSGKQIWHRGRANLDSVLAQLRYEFGLANASEVILTGGSAGGLAVYLHIDHVAASLPNARVIGFPDAGYFADLPNTQGVFVYRSYFQRADAIWNSSAGGGSNLRCLRKYGHTSEGWKCLMAQHVMPFIETPLFVMNAALDVYQVQNTLQVGCVPDRCSAAQFAHMDRYRLEFLDALEPALHYPNGAFVNSCIMHEQNVYYCSDGDVHALNCQGWMREQVNGTTPQQAFLHYYTADAAHGIFTWIDNVSWPKNPTCAWQFSGAQLGDVLV